MIAERYEDQLRGLPDVLRPYIDWDRFARDLEMSGEVHFVEIGGAVHAFDMRCG